MFRKLKLMSFSIHLIVLISTLVVNCYSYQNDSSTNRTQSDENLNETWIEKFVQLLNFVSTNIQFLVGSIWQHLSDIITLISKFGFKIILNLLRTIGIPSAYSMANTIDLIGHLFNFILSTF